MTIPLSTYLEPLQCVIVSLCSAFLLASMLLQLLICNLLMYLNEGLSSLGFSEADGLKAGALRRASIWLGLRYQRVGRALMPCLVSWGVRQTVV